MSMLENSYDTLIANSKNQKEHILSMIGYQMEYKPRLQTRNFKGDLVPEDIEKIEAEGIYIKRLLAVKKEENEHIYITGWGKGIAKAKRAYNIDRIMNNFLRLFFITPNTDMDIDMAKVLIVPSVWCCLLSVPYWGLFGSFASMFLFFYYTSKLEV